MPSCGWPSLAAEVFSLYDKAADAPALIVGERPTEALRSGRDVSAARPSRSEPFVPYPVQAACRKAPATKVDLPPEGSRERTQERADRARIMQAYAPGLPPRARSGVAE